MMDVDQMAKGLGEQIDRYFDRFEKRIDTIDRRLAGVEGRLAGVEGRLIKVEEQVVETNDQSCNLEEIQGGMNSAVEPLDNRFGVVENAINRIATKVGVAKIGDPLF